MRFLISGFLGGAWGLFCSKAIGGAAGMFATLIGAFVIGFAVSIAWMRKP